VVQSGHAPCPSHGMLRQNESSARLPRLTISSLQGDLPMTVFTTAHSGVHFSPVNYLEGNPSVETVNMVRISYKDGNTSSVVSFASSNQVCELDYKPQSVDLWDYKGDVVVRKYPYDPQNPYYFTTLDIPI
jgi:primary-amine oxidase